MPNRLYLTPFFICIFFLLYSALAQAEKISVVTEYLQPYQIKNADGSLGGYATEIIYALFKITGDTPDIQVLPWPRAYMMAQKNENTLIFSMARTAAREKQFNWVGRLIEEQLYFWRLKSNSNKKINTISDIRSSIVSVTKNSNTSQFAQHQNFRKLIYVTAETQNMKMLFKNRVDFILGSELSFLKRSEELGLDINKIEKVLRVPELKSDLSVAFSLQTSEKLVAKYKDAFIQLKASGKLIEIKRRWGLESNSTEIPGL